LKIGPLAPHTELLSNIEGAVAGPDVAAKDSANSANSFGAEAVSENVLRVRLRRGDSSFPSLVAHSVFRPVKVAHADETRRIEAHDLVSNGAFHLSGTDNNQVLLERATTYWDGGSVALQRVAFVNSGSPENALSAYYAGEVDAVTNAPFEPLALKLLAGYKDFRRSTFGALTYYKFNSQREPFDDVRVREALAIAIDRERVSRDHLGGATQPAGKFLPETLSEAKPVVDKTELLELDAKRARELLAEAGFPNGDGFPQIRLLINRNEQQRIVAEAIAAMWKTALNIETEIVLKNWDEYEASIKAGDYDVVRRGMVMQTTDELTNLRMIFDSVAVPAPVGSPDPANPKTLEGRPTEMLVGEIDSEEQALKELKVMPIYFASSYAMVKPYIAGFDANILDAPSLKRTRVDTSWVEKKP